MNPAKEALWKKATDRAAVEPQLATQLGLVTLVGMEAIAQMEALAGPGLDNVYHTEFPMPDGQHWELVLSKLDASDAR